MVTIKNNSSPCCVRFTGHCCAVHLFKDKILYWFPHWQIFMKIFWETRFELNIMIIVSHIFIECLIICQILIYYVFWHLYRFLFLFSVGFGNQKLQMKCLLNAYLCFIDISSQIKSRAGPTIKWWWWWSS